MDGPKRQMIEYKFLRASTQHNVPRIRSALFIYLMLFHVAFIVLYAFFARYRVDTSGDKPKEYSSKLI